MKHSKLKMMEWQGAAFCPGSCGELVQGTWNGINFLVPCPINLFSVARVKLRPGLLVSGPSDRPKAVTAVRKTLDYFACRDMGGELSIESEIPAGKGMASSTADIGAAIGATASALGLPLKPQDFARIAISIEPTDATLLPGITLLDHVKGQWSLGLGSAPAAQILVIDTGGEVDTLQFNALPRLSELNKQNEPLTKQAFQLVRRGIQEKDLSLLGRGTTLSAEANQNILCKALLQELKNWALQRGSYGLIAAHSGTVLGLLFSQQTNLLQEEQRLLQRFPEIGNILKVQLISGGVKIMPVTEEYHPCIIV